VSAPLTPPLDLVTTAVLALLRTGGRTVYDGAFRGDPMAPSYPYDVLYAVPGGSSDPFPDLEDDSDEVVVPYQVTSVSDLRNQAQWQARQARDLLVGRGGGAYATPFAMPAGWACVRRWSDAGLPGVIRTGDHPNAIFSVPARYLLAVVPA
jgi:hypothetical protein